MQKPSQNKGCEGFLYIREDFSGQIPLRQRLSHNLILKILRILNLIIFRYKDGVHVIQLFNQPHALVVAE